METNTVIIGAGHAGLAMSRCLADRGIDHIVLERGLLGERWRTGRWDSFRLLTPNWMTRLPGWSYSGDDPDGFMDAAGLVGYLDAYARSFGAPVVEMTAVTRVQQVGDGYLVRTDRGDWHATNVVVATGYHSRPRVPDVAAGLSPELVQLTPARYRRPSQLPDAGVLVVGASASGVQIADELVASGRPVTLAVGRHTRLPRQYRGRDTLWWLDRIGSFDRTIDELPDPELARSEPSLQLSGAGRDVDLGVLRQRGVRLTGRLVGVTADVAIFADDLAGTTATADARLRRVLDDIDRYAEERLADGSPAARPPAVVTEPGPGRIALSRAGIGSVVWATGFEPNYPWLQVPVLDGSGRFVHRGGVTSAPGLYAIGLRFQHRRNSTFIDGARHDAEYLAGHIAARPGKPRRGGSLRHLPVGPHLPAPHRTETSDV